MSGSILERMEVDYAEISSAFWSTNIAQGDKKKMRNKSSILVEERDWMRTLWRRHQYTIKKQDEDNTYCLRAVQR